MIAQAAVILNNSFSEISLAYMDHEIDVVG